MSVFQRFSLSCRIRKTTSVSQKAGVVTRLRVDPPSVPCLKFPHKQLGQARALTIQLTINSPGVDLRASALSALSALGVKLGCQGDE